MEQKGFFYFVIAVSMRDCRRFAANIFLRQPAKGFELLFIFNKFD